MLEAYSQEALDELLAQVPRRRGWDFSRMNVLRTSGNVRFRVGSARLEAISETFDVILDR
jgi:hypothetical protein